MTAEYGMLPASTGERKQRDISKGKQDGRADRDPAPDRPQPARRRRPRGARRAHDLRRLRRARGRRRHALRGDHRRLRRARARVPPAAGARACWRKSPLTGSIAAVSCGVVDGIPLLDLDYPEDSSAEVDANVVMTGEGGLVEVQATAERTPLSRTHLDELLALAQTGIEGLRAAQEAALRDEAAARDPQRPQAARVRAAAARRDARRRCPTSAPTPGGDRRHLRRERADQGPRGGAGDRPRRRSPTTPASRPRRSAGAPACAPRASPARTPPTARTSTKLHREAPAGSRARYVCVIAHVTPEGEEHLFEGTLRGHARRAPQRRGRLRLRPALRRRRDAGPHDGRAHGRREGRDLPPRPRRPGAARMAEHALTGATSRTHARPQPRRRGLDRLEHDPDRAQGRRGHPHRLGRDPHRGAALGHRPAGEPDRVLLRPPRRGAGRRRPPLRPREVRERRRGRRGDADPGRLAR